MRSGRPKFRRKLCNITRYYKIISVIAGVYGQGGKMGSKLKKIHYLIQN